MPNIPHLNIYSRLSRCNTARGSSLVLTLSGPAKVKARKSFLFTEGSLKLKIKKTFLILLSQSGRAGEVPPALR